MNPISDANTTEARQSRLPTTNEEVRWQKPEQVFRAELLRFVADYIQKHSDLELSMVTKSLKCLSSLVTVGSRDVDMCCGHMNDLVNPGAETFFYSTAKSNGNDCRLDTFLASYGKWVAHQG